MSQQADASIPPHSMVIQADSSSTNPLPNPHGTHGGTHRTKDTEMNEGRVSGELEGSTLGSSSRDGERGVRAQRRTQSSSFMLDSAFISKSKSLRTSQQQRHRPRRSEPDHREKRGPPEAENTGSKKKSRFSWNRQKRSFERSPSEPVDAGSGASREDPQSSNTPRVEEEHHEPEVQGETSRGSIGLDQDSIQIVNLALDLSESRKRGSLGRSGSHRVSGGSWTVPARQTSVHHADSHMPTTIGGDRGRSQAHRSLDHSQPLDSPRPSANAPWSVSNLLPDTVNDASLPHDISDSTLARVAKARSHFELFGECLRLLPSLPPLRQNASHTSSKGNSASARTYNPLQTIRNRKVRYREKCPINLEAEGWYDVPAVHEWVNTVGQQYSQQPHGPLECLRLPRFQPGHPPSQGEPDYMDLFDAASPPDSVRRGRRSSSAKARRPRFDWIVDPAELLADAVWVEDGLNKSKLLDREGNNLYPDPTELISSDANLGSSRRASVSGKRVSLDVPSRVSVSDSHPRMSSDYKGIGRGRSRHRFESPSSAVHSSSASAKDRRFRQRRSNIRSRSSSSISMGAELSQRSEFSSPLSTKMMDPNDPRIVPTQDVDSPLYKPKKSSAWASYEDKRRASLSSAASVDDRRNRMSLDTKGSTAPNSPLYPGFFPSIAANLSPPSSRSPSPTKKPFPRRIVARHERGKSKHRSIEAHERGRDSMDSEHLRKRSAPSAPDAPNRSGKLEPSPLPDQVSSSYQDEQAGDEPPTGRNSGQHESKLRGIFKGRGKIAEIVGNEVSKVGDFILKKDHPAHSRQSSFATSATSDDVDSEAANNYNRTSGPKNFLRRLPTVSDDSGRLSRREMEKDVPKTDTSAFASSNGHEEQRGLSDFESPRASMSVSRGRDTNEPPKETDRTAVAQQEKSDAYVNENFGPPLRITQEHNRKKPMIKDGSAPLVNPPVTGLAQAEATPPQSANEKRPTLSGSWTISERSIPTLSDMGIPQKREIERTRALLLSSGIKAREITRRAETVRDPPPEFLQKTVDSDSPILRVTRLEEYDLAAQNLRGRFGKSQIQFQQSMDHFPMETASPLKSQLHHLDDLVSRSLAPRVRAVASDAEGLSIQLNTTSTLALKQLSDTLDKGVRKRRRRLRWVRRAGFVMLEWALVGMLWWVWLIVMAFKLLRGVFRGAISGIRWVLWL